MNIPKDWHLSSSDIILDCKCGNKVKLDYDGECFEGYIGFCDCGNVLKISSYELEAMDEMKERFEGPQVKVIAKMKDGFSTIIMVGNENWIINNIKEEYGFDSIKSYITGPID